MRKIIFVSALFLLSAVSARAQQADLFAGYSFVHYDQAGATANLNGWNLSVNYKLGQVVGIVGDVGGTYGTPASGSTGLHTFLGGPQFSVPGKVSPFFHVMFGGAHLDIAGSGSTSFSTAIGGGVDFKTAPHIAIRAIQFDDLITRFAGSTQNNPRISVGIVFTF